MMDVLIIGAGVTGCAIARELSRYKLKTCVLEKEEDVCCGTSKANSAIMHAGYDCQPGTLKAEMNVRGNELVEDLSKELDFEFKRIGSLVICLDSDDRSGLQKLYDQGISNGVKGLRIIEQDELRQLEPNISDSAVAALYAPSAGIVCPFGMNIAFAENAFNNGVEFKFDTTVNEIRKENGIFVVSTSNGIYKSRVVINAAGVYADVFHNMMCSDKIEIKPRRGEYELLDRSTEGFVKHTIFQMPSPSFGKGVLVSPTVHGNTIIGPTADDIGDKEDCGTTAAGMDKLKEKAGASLKNIPFRQVITSFAGLRAHISSYAYAHISTDVDISSDADEHINCNKGDFIIGESMDNPGFIDCAGIESPGLSSAPAIGEKVAKIVHDILKPEMNESFNGTRQGILKPASLSRDEYSELIKKNPSYGHIICRCEMVTEGEIIDSIKRPLGAKSLDGVKRRTRAGMGRCQAGFCSPRTMEIISRELGIDQDQVTKCGEGSKLITGKEA